MLQLIHPPKKITLACIACLSFIERRWNKDLKSATVLFLCLYNLFCRHLFIGTKRCIYFSEFFTCNDLKIGAFMYSETCIERSPSEDGVPLKTMKNAILCRNWSLYVQKLVKNISNINFNFSFNWVLLINVIVHYRWKTIKVTTTT